MTNFGRSEVFLRCCVCVKECVCTSGGSARKVPVSFFQRGGAFKDAVGISLCRVVSDWPSVEECVECCTRKMKTHGTSNASETEQKASINTRATEKIMSNKHAVQSTCGQETFINRWCKVFDIFSTFRRLLNSKPPPLKIAEASPPCQQAPPPAWYTLLGYSLCYARYDGMLVLMCGCVQTRRGLTTSRRQSSPCRRSSWTSSR